MPTPRSGSATFGPLALGPCPGETFMPSMAILPCLTAGTGTAKDRRSLKPLNSLRYRGGRRSETLRPGENRTRSSPWLLNRGRELSWWFRSDNPLGWESFSWLRNGRSGLTTRSLGWEREFLLVAEKEPPSVVE